MRIQLRTFPLLLVASLLTGTLWAADDPFVGKWKVNPSKSKLTDEMKVEAVGANKYAITFEPGAVDTIVADGTDQPALQGTTLSVTADRPNHWKVVRKKEGRTIVTGFWTLSGDGTKLNDDFTYYPHDGPTVKLHYVYERTAGSSGFTGTWDSMTTEVDSSIELAIQHYEGDGLSFNGPTARMSIKFDGNDHSDPKAGPGYASSGRRVNERSLEITDKFQGKITDTRQMELSTDLRTLTVAIRATGETQPKNIYVFERE
jgi:hypothetical protein